MKQTKKIVIILVMILMLTTGCTKSFKDEKTTKSTQRIYYVSQKMKNR